MEELEYRKDMQDYVVILRKRKIAILIIVFAILIFTTSIAFLLPPVYKSSATILIEQQEIPPELIMSTVTSYAAERIQMIQARVMSRSNLLKIVDRFELYNNKRLYETSEEIVERIREDINLEVISAEVMDPRTGRPSAATIAFSLSYKYKTPGKAQKVTSELTSLYLNENLKTRTQKAADTSEFFAEEIGRLDAQISELESKLATFKEENADLLPELQKLNLDMLQRTESEILSLDTQLRSLDDRRFYLTGQLEQIEPGNPGVPSVEMRLKVLKAEYASATSKYSSEHPDIQKLKREIESLENESAHSNEASIIADQLKALRSELAQKRESYTSEHPDILSLEEKIASLNQELKKVNDNQEGKYSEQQPDNPAYITLKAQLSSTESEIKAIKQQKANVEKKLKDLEQRLFKAPQVEREYLMLKRDYDNAVRQYDQTKTKQMRADVAKQLESESKGERFTLIDPPALPEKPISPNRPAIMFLGLIFSLVIGIGYAFVFEAASGAVRGTKSIEKVLGVHPLAILPYQYNVLDISNKIKYRKRIFITTIAGIFIGLLVIHIFISPLDVLWFRILRKVEIILS